MTEPTGVGRRARDHGWVAHWYPRGVRYHYDRAIPPRGIMSGFRQPGARNGMERPNGCRDPRADEPVRVHPPQGRLPEAVAPYRGSGPWPAEDGGGREVLHRHPDAGLGDDQGVAVGGAWVVGRAPESLRGAGRRRRRPGGGREDPGGLGGHRPTGPLLSRPVAAVRRGRTPVRAGRAPAPSARRGVPALRVSVPDRPSGPDPPR